MIGQRPADEHVLATLSRAKALIEGCDFASATLVYVQLLETDLAAPLRGEVLTNLGAALCVLARGQRDAAALARLDQARDLLVTALSYRQRTAAPEAWAMTRANLAVVHLARYEATGNSEELLSAHLALDGIEQALRDTAETAELDWIRAIRDQLLELRDRRSRRR